MRQVSRSSAVHGAVHGAVHWLYVAGAVGRLDSELEGFVSVNKRLAAATAEYESRQQEPDRCSNITVLAAGNSHTNCHHSDMKVTLALATCN